MNRTEWKTALRVLASGKDFRAKNGTTICKFPARYGFEYSVHVPGIGCIMVDYDLQRIKEILVD